MSLQNLLKIRRLDEHVKSWPAENRPELIV